MLAHIACSSGIVTSRKPRSTRVIQDCDVFILLASCTWLMPARLRSVASMPPNVVVARFAMAGRVSTTDGWGNDEIARDIYPS
jgi:hypothetical protein